MDAADVDTPRVVLGQLEGNFPYIVESDDELEPGTAPQFFFCGPKTESVQANLAVESEPGTWIMGVQRERSSPPPIEREYFPLQTDSLPDRPVDTGRALFETQRAALEKQDHVLVKIAPGTNLDVHHVASPVYVRGSVGAVDISHAGWVGLDLLTETARTEPIDVRSCIAVNAITDVGRQASFDSILELGLVRQGDSDAQPIDIAATEFLEMMITKGVVTVTDAPLTCRLNYGNGAEISLPGAGSLNLNQFWLDDQEHLPPPTLDIEGRVDTLMCNAMGNFRISGEVGLSAFWEADNPDFTDAVFTDDVLWMAEQVPHMRAADTRHPTILIEHDVRVDLDGNWTIAMQVDPDTDERAWRLQNQIRDTGIRRQLCAPTRDLRKREIDAQFAELVAAQDAGSLDALDPLDPGASSARDAANLRRLEGSVQDLYSRGPDVPANEARKILEETRGLDNSRAVEIDPIGDANGPAVDDGLSPI